MSDLPEDRKYSKVVSLVERRDRHNAEAHARGENFVFAEVEEPELCVGTTDNEVILRFVIDGLDGYALSIVGARKLGVALIEAAAFLDLQHAGLVRLPGEETDSTE